MGHRSTASSVDFMFQSARGSIAEEQDEQQPGHVASPSDSGKDADNRVITLCVGGTEFSTTQATLTAAPGSYLAVLFGGRWTPSVFKPGTQVPFVDRDPTYFKYVLAYLRALRQGSQVILPESPVELKHLHAEAEFYGLPGLAQACILGRFSSALNLAGPHPQQHSGMYREPTFATMQKLPSNNNSDAQAWNSFVSSSTAQRSVARHPNTAGQTSNSSDISSEDGAAPISGDDVQVSLHQQAMQQQAMQQVPCLTQCVHTAQQLLAKQQQSCADQPQRQQMVDLVLKHLLHLPLAAQQPDLATALAAPEDGMQLQFALQYYPVGDLRIELECKLIPASCSTAANPTALTSAQAAGFVTPTTSISCAAEGHSPQLSPRDANFQRPASATMLASRTPSGSLLPTLAAARPRSTSPIMQEESHAAAAAAAVGSSSPGSGVTPGPGWGGTVVYHKYSIRETADKFTLTTHMPGEGQIVEEASRVSYRPELNKYSTLHKLLVQQCPRSSVAGLIWMLEAAGFASVKLSTSLETYFVGHNSFPGYKSMLTFEV